MGKGVGRGRCSKKGREGEGRGKEWEREGEGGAKRGKERRKGEEVGRGGRKERRKRKGEGKDCSPKGIHRGVQLDRAWPLAP